MKTYKQILLTILICIISNSTILATDWYVSPEGTNSLSNGQGTSKDKPFQTIQYAQNQCEPGDIVYVMNGTYRNNGFETGNKYNPAVVSITKSGTSGNYITIRNYPGHKPRIEFDGAGGFIAGKDINYIKIIGFTIVGPNDKITIQEALDNRTDDSRPKYYNGAGIAFWGPSHHIEIRWNKVYDCPNSGIRANKSDYVIFADNTVGRTCWYSPSGASGMVIALAKEIDQTTGNKFIIERNKVFDNRNYVPIYLQNTVNGDYGGPDYDKIVDGRGIYMTRNPDYDSGTYLIKDNIAYGNGFGGITFHISNNGKIINNTLYKNGDDGGVRQGITIAKAKNVQVYNNIIYAQGKVAIQDQTFAGISSGVVLKNNLIYNGTSDFSGENTITDENPDFVDPDKGNFKLKSTSPAIDRASFGTSTDNSRIPRPQRGSFDLGALEYQTIPFNKEISLKSKANNKFVIANTDLNADFPQLTATSSSANDNSKLTIKRTGSLATLSSSVNDKYVTVRTKENSKILRAMQKDITNNEKFYIYQNTDGTLTFKSKVNGKYVFTDDNNRNDIITATASSVSTATKFSFEVSKSASIDEPKEIVYSDQALKLYPNPSRIGSDVLMDIPTTLSGQKIYFEVIDNSGKIVATDIITDKDQYTFNTEKISAGIYLFKFVSNDTTIIKRFIAY